MNPLSIELLSPVKKVSRLNQERNMLKHILQVKTVRNCSKEICRWNLM